MPFDSQYRYLAFSAETLQSASLLRDGFGDLANTAPDARGRKVKTLLCSKDKSSGGKLRALELGVSANPISLSDGRFCLGGFWSDGAIAAFEAGDIAGEELTREQVRSLTIKEEI